MPSALSIPQEVVDEVLRMGGNTAHHREQIVAAFEKRKPDTPDFLRSLLHGGNGIVTDEISTNRKGLRQTIRIRLQGIGNVETPFSTIGK